MSLRCLAAVPVLWACLLSGSFGQEDAAEPPKKEAVRPTGIYFQYALYFAPDSKGDPFKQASEIFHKSFNKQFTYRAGVVKFTKGTYVEFRLAEPKEYTPPDAEYLKHKGFGVTETEGQRIQKTASVLLMDFFIVQPDGYDYLLAANQLAIAVAEATGGFIWDEETREMYSVAAWKVKRLSAEGLVFANTSMHGYQLKSGNFRMVTFGMRKLGLPDLVITEFPKAFWEPFSEMMQFLANQIASQGPLKPKTSWTEEELRTSLGQAPDSDLPSLALVPASRDEGDPRNDLVTVDFSAYPGENYHEQQAYTVDQLFRPKGGLLDVWRQREKLMALSDQARQKLKEKKELIQNGLPEKEQLLVKAYIAQEYLWMRVKTWGDEDKIKGFRVPNSIPGQPVPASDLQAAEAQFDDVFDYLHILADGKEEGNETTKFIQKIQQEKAKAESPDAKRSSDSKEAAY
ncbi:MAG: hypothetical protein ACI957_002260 [Verrucomicrobiales bacterium]|jgi:hypothetical protein